MTRPPRGRSGASPRVPAPRGVGAWLFLAALLVAAPLSASVFMRLRAPAAGLLEATGGRVVYRAGASVSGEDASITVLGFDRPLRETLSSVRSSWGLPGPAAGASPAAGGAWLAKTENGRRQTLLLLPGNSPGSCSAWLVETSARMGPAAPPPPPPGGNPLPSADLVSWIGIRSGKTLLTVHETTAPPAACLAEVSAHLRADGWAPVVEGPSCSLFSNGGKAGAAAAFPSERPGVTRAVVIRQR